MIDSTFNTADCNVPKTANYIWDQRYASPGPWAQRVGAECDGSRYGVAVQWLGAYYYCASTGGYGAYDVCLDAKLAGTPTIPTAGLLQRCEYPTQSNMCGLGHPTVPDTGTKVFLESDFQVANSSLHVTRRYNSRGALSPITIAAGLLGDHWRTAYDRRVYSLTGSGYTMMAVRPDFKVKYFTSSGNELFHFAGSPAETLVSLRTGGWIYTTGRDEVETYDAQGRLIALWNKADLTTTLAYDTSGRLASVTDARGRTLTYSYSTGFTGYGIGWVSIAASDGTTVRYDMDRFSNLSLVTRTGGSTRQYLYENPQTELITGIIDENNSRYETVEYYGDGSQAGDWRVKKTYLAPTVASGSIERNTFTYNVDGSTTVVGPLGATYTLSFVAVNGVNNVASVSQPCPSCGMDVHEKTYDSAGYLLSKTDFRGSVTSYTYDDARGLETQRVEASNDNSASSAKRTVATDWAPSFRVPVERRTYNASNILEAKTRWLYNGRGQVAAKCEIDVGDAAALAYSCSDVTAPSATAKVRRWVTRYCESADVAAPNSTCPILGLVKSVDGPRATTDAGMAGLDDLVTYTYYAATDESGCATLGGACHRKGDLWKITNALGQVAESISYDRNGRLTRSKDENGFIIDMAYNARGWLVTRSRRHFASGTPSVPNDVTTTFAYDAVGNVTQVTQPDGEYLGYTYDAAHRLVKVTDNLGNAIDYCPGGVGNTECLDAAGNRRVELTKDGGAAIKRRLHRAYNSLSRLVTTLNEAGSVTRDSDSFDSGGLTDGYDGNGNAVHFSHYPEAGASIETNQAVDPLNRLIQTLQDTTGSDPTTSNAKTDYTYDARDNLLTVKDPSLLTTTYIYDTLNNLIALDSPDTAHTSSTYDRAGNRLTQTDNRFVTTTYTYDVLNRLTAITYADTTQNVSFAYDESNATTGCVSSTPVGRLTRMTDNSGSTTYCYDSRGNVLKKSQINDTFTYDTAYTWTKGDRLGSVTYPSGAIVAYGHDGVGRVNLVTWQSSAGAAPVTVVSGASYYPFGPLNQLTYGNARTLTKTYDADYAIDKIVSSDANGLILDFSTDRLGNIVNASSSVGANPPTRKYLYDHLYRLSEVDNGSNVMQEDYAYNLTGDRTSKQFIGQAAQVYTYLAGTHHLGSVAGVNRDYDPVGNTEDTGNDVPFVYSERNRMSDYLASPHSTHFTYNGRGERVLKRTGSSSFGSTETRTVYDERGQVAEYRTYSVSIAGKRTQTGIFQIVYLDDQPIAQISNGVLSYLEADHLGTPRIAADPTTNAQQWKWDFFGDAFGGNAATIAPSGGIDVKLRYPGQVFDAETGLHYNYFRDFEPGTGRYMESDPIGLEGGAATYGYVLDNPINLLDFFGLVVDINLFKKGSPEYGYAELYPGNPSECTIAGHGTPYSLAGKGARTLNNLIDGTPSCKGKTIRLLACNTGVSPGGGKPPFGDRLAKKSNQHVWAPNNWGWLTSLGNYYIGPTNPTKKYPMGVPPDADQTEAGAAGMACNCGNFVEFEP